MSNVLIGIIGVILFIGLALAGALFLGPRFQEATTNSTASAQVQAIRQIAEATNMYRVQEGSDTADIDLLVSKGYLKARPSDPTGVGANYIIVKIGNAPHVLIGGRSSKLCSAINKQMLGSGAATPTTPDSNAPLYCYGSGNENEFFVTARI